MRLANPLLRPCGAWNQKAISLAFIVASLFAHTLGCSDGSEHQGSGGAAPGGGGGAAGSAGSAGGSPGVGEDGFSGECPEKPLVSPEARGVLAINAELRVADKPLTLGEANPLAEAGSLLPSNVRFYVSGFAFKSKGISTLGTLVNGQGVALPYNVQLINAEDPSSTRFFVAVPPGTYDEFSFIVGVTEACNETPGPLKSPLHDASQMKWPHVAGFLFLRYEGQRSDDAPQDLPDNIHMGMGTGADRFAPKITIAGPITVTGERMVSALNLVFALDAALKAAAMQTDLSDFEVPFGEEVRAGERLRRNAKTVVLFSRK